MFQPTNFYQIIDFLDASIYYVLKKGIYGPGTNFCSKNNCSQTTIDRRKIIARKTKNYYYYFIDILYLKKRSNKIGKKNGKC